MPWQSAINNLDFFYLMFDRSEVYGPMQVNFLSATAEKKTKNVIPIFMKLLHLLSSALSSVVGLSEETGHSSV